MEIVHRERKTLFLKESQKLTGEGIIYFRDFKKKEKLEKVVG